MDRYLPHALAGVLGLALLAIIATIAVRGMTELASSEPDPELPAASWESPQPEEPAELLEEPRRMPAERPPRFDRGLPRTPEALYDEGRYLPTHVVAARLSFGDPDARAEVLSAAEALARAGMSRAEVEAALGPMLHTYRTRTHCGWVRRMASEHEGPLTPSFVGAAADCDVVESRAAREPAPEAPFDELLQDEWFAAEQLIAWAEGREDRLGRALVRCTSRALEEGADHRAAHCLRTLAVLDRPLAVQTARTLAGHPLHGWLEETVTALTRYDTVESLRDALDAHGLLRDAMPGARALPPSSAWDVLASHGRALCFETETVRFPNHHDALLTRLAYLARPDLDGVVFEERPPNTDAYGKTVGPYGLYAYADGYRHDIDARDFGDWYDVEAVLRLLDAILEARGSEVRFVPLVPDGERTCLVAGPPEGVRAAAEEGLLTLQNADASPE